MNKIALGDADDKRERQHMSDKLQKKLK